MKKDDKKSNDMEPNTCEAEKIKNELEGIKKNIQEIGQANEVGVKESGEVIKNPNSDNSLIKRIFGWLF